MKKEEMLEKATRTWTHWFEIPVADFERGKKFYETIFDLQIQPLDFGGLKMGIFPHKEVGCAICHGEHYTPGNTGPVVSMNANPDLSAVLNRIEAAGGKILQNKKQISPEYGFMALFEDSEGNRLALHSDQ